MRERQSNIELLRIIAMIGIVMHHFCVHGSFTFTPRYNRLTKYSFNFSPFLAKRVWPPLSS